MVTPKNPQIPVVLLAAGRGRRMGGPKGLLRDDRGRSLVACQVESIRRAAALEPNLDPDPIVVLGAAAQRVEHLVPAGARIVHNPDWASGMGGSLAAGLRAVPADAPGALVMLLDLPHVPAEALARLAAQTDPGQLARALWNGVPGHPVAIGAAHIPAAITACHGDAGARGLFAAVAPAAVNLVECADLLAPGVHGDADIDTPEQAAAAGLRLPAALPARGQGADPREDAGRARGERA
ncbi:nucleotidyltransferase family protein [Brevibacterium sp. 50QC2O2]|uniref:nucleotidyltransferase family protein n=1 Tax=unclassified Brevibacterium TaxID=2614124 RepID=UPI00211CB0DA|nr:MULTISPECIES: nucleotidyltransferase family protein [unclassified Brevibacterium]MCQ9368794.1 nucleotidyltransferase family protein [Brevibacterium sp. 91QC2O2]MCQ9388561.1 nucleotidyltransferase family protein [Brevibacterium sp. 50QC2O2]